MVCGKPKGKSWQLTTLINLNSISAWLVTCSFGSEKLLILADNMLWCVEPKGKSWQLTTLI